MEDYRDYRLTYTEEAGATRDLLPPDRRALLERGLRILLADPFPKSSAQIGAHPYDREVQVAPGLLVEYVVVHGYLLIVVLRVFDDSLIDTDGS